MADTNVFAVARLQSGFLDDAVAGSVNRGAARCGPVHASVHLGVAEDGVAAQTKTRAHDPGEHRLANQETPPALARPGVVVDQTIARALEAVEMLCISASRT